MLTHRAELDEAECRRLLARATVGRISFTDGALPVVVPVPFALAEGQVLIPAQEGSRLAEALHGAVVAFEVDDFDAATETGWSVTVVGPSRTLRDPARLATGSAVPVPEHWTAPGCRLLAVQMGRLRGWRADGTDDDADDDAAALYHDSGSSAG